MHVCVTYIEYYGWGGTLLGFIDYIDPESEKKGGCCCFKVMKSGTGVPLRVRFHTEVQGPSWVYIPQVIFLTSVGWFDSSIELLFFVFPVVWGD